MKNAGTVALPAKLVRDVLKLSEELEQWAWSANPHFLREMRRVRREDRKGLGRSHEEVKAQFGVR